MLYITKFSILLFETLLAILKCQSLQNYELCYLKFVATFENRALLDSTTGTFFLVGGTFEICPS